MTVKELYEKVVDGIEEYMKKYGVEDINDIRKIV